MSLELDKMGNVLNMYTKETDYSGNRTAAINLIGKLRAYWNNEGYQPQFELTEEFDKDGKKLFSIRSDINSVMPFKMSKLSKN